MESEYALLDDLAFIKLEEKLSELLTKNLHDSKLCTIYINVGYD